jgi:hypothetical protein
MRETQKFYQGETITTTISKSLDSEIDDFLTPSQIFKNPGV